MGSDNNQTEYTWDIVPHDSPEIQKAILNVPHKPEVKDTHFWNDPEFQSYKNPVGRERICREIEQLKEYGWHILACRNKTNGIMMLQITDSHIGLRLVIPPEYPLNPPGVLTPDNKRMVDLKTVREWNSTVALVDVVSESRQIQNCPTCCKRHLAEL